MKPKLKVLAVSLALAATSVHAGAAIHTGDSGKLVPTRVPDTVLTAFLPPTAHSSVAVFSEPAPRSVFTAGGIDAIATVTSGTPAATIRPKTNTRLSTKARMADGGSANDLPEARSSAEEHFSSAADRQFSATTVLSVPEPGNWAMVLAGLLGVGAIARRRMSS